MLLTLMQRIIQHRCFAAVTDNDPFVRRNIRHIYNRPVQEDNTHISTPRLPETEVRNKVSIRPTRLFRRTFTIRG